MEKFDMSEKKDMNKPYCSDYSLSGKADKDQTDDAYIALSELRACGNSSNLCKYMDLFALITTDNKLMSIITYDTGYKPFLIYRDYLIDELNFTLENEYGLTDMVNEYTYHGNSFILKYDMLCDAIYFSVDIKDEKIPKCFFETISYLEKIDVEKFKC